MLDRDLIIEIKLPDRLDFIPEKLNARRHALLPGKDIQNPPADRELPSQCHLGDLFVPSLNQLPQQLFPIKAFGARQGQTHSLDAFGRRKGFLQGSPAEHHQLRAFA